MTRLHITHDDTAIRIIPLVRLQWFNFCNFAAPGEILYISRQRYITVGTAYIVDITVACLVYRQYHLINICV